MKIKIWGSRGSLPTPGSTTLRYGGNTTCIEIRLTDGTLIIIDAGSGFKWLGDSLMREKGLTDIYLFFTHAHWDHIMGFPFFTPIYLSRFNIHMRGGPDAKESIRKFLSHQMQPPFFPVDFSQCKATFDITSGEPHIKQIGSAEIIPIKLNHPDGGYGFKFIDNNKSFIFLTDNELGFKHPGGLDFDDYAAFSENTDFLIHDAQYSPEEIETKRSWGHSSLTDACSLAIKSGAKKFGIFHNDPNRTDEMMDGFSGYCREKLIRPGFKTEFINIKEGLEIIL